MASFAPIRGTRSQINNTPLVDGQFLVETDQGDQNKTYIDAYDSSTPPVLRRTMCGGGGHEIIPTIDSSSANYPPTPEKVVTAVQGATPTTDQIVSAYGTQQWSNTENINLLTTLTAGENTIGFWEEDESDPDKWKDYDPATDDPTVYREGWIYHKYLYHILSDNDVEIRIVNDIIDGNVASLNAYRVDDEVYVAQTPVGTENPQEQGWFELVSGSFVLSTDTTVTGGKTYYAGVGAVAIKLNNSFQTNTTVGVKLVKQRTQTITVSVL